MKKLYYYILATPLLATAFCALFSSSAGAYESNLNVDWTKTLDGDGSRDILRGGALLPNGNVFAVGETNSTTFDNGLTVTNNGYDDALIMEIDPSDGSAVWMKSYSYGENNNESLTKVIKASDGNYVAIGTLDSDAAAVIVKFAPNGDVIWETAWGGNGSINELVDITNSNDGNIVIVANSRSTDLENAPNHGNTDAVLIKIDIKTGAVLKQASWGGTSYEYAYGIAPSKENSYIVTGILYSTDIPGVTGVEGTPGFVAEFDENFNNIWTSLYSVHPGSETLDAIELDDGSIFGGGFSAWATTNPLSIHFEGYTALYDKDGNEIWHNTNQTSGIKSVPTAHHIDKKGYIEAGVNNAEGDDKSILVTKYSPIDGDIVWQKHFGVSYDDTIYGAVPISNHEYLLLGLGYPASSGVGGQIAMAKISEEVKANVEYHIDSAEAPKNANIPTDGEVTWSKNNDGVSVPSAKGWIFDGWYIDEAKTIKYDPSTAPAGDLQLYGTWDKDPNAIDNPDTDDNIPKAIIYTCLASIFMAPLAAYTLKRR